jgi:hypothetical protein
MAGNRFSRGIHQVKVSINSWLNAKLKNDGRA